MGTEEQGKSNVLAAMIEHENKRRKEGGILEFLCIYYHSHALIREEKERRNLEMNMIHNFLVLLSLFSTNPNIS